MIIHMFDYNSREFDPAMPQIKFQIFNTSLSSTPITAHDLIIGRDVLNQLNVTLNGLALVTQISDH